jgi:type IV secretory pathway VirB6-like protein
MLRALRRSSATAALLLVALCASSLLSVAYALGLPTLPLGLGLLCGAGLVLFAEGLRRRRRAAQSALRSRRRATTADQAMGRRYDLAKDRTTDGQRWLM